LISYSSILTTSSVTSDLFVNLDVPGSTSTKITPPGNNNHDTCLIQGAVDSTTVVTYYLLDSYKNAASPYSITGTFTSCNTNLCPTERLDINGDSVPTLSISQSGGAYTISSSDSSLVGNTYQVNYRAVWPTDSLTNCVLFTKAFTLNIKGSVSIVPQTIPNQVYIISDPTASISLPVFSLSTA